MSPSLGRASLRRSQRKRKPENNDLDKRLVTILDPTSAASEAYRTLRTNLLHAFVDEPPKVIVLTSPSKDEGKSVTCINLGIVLAQASRRTLILDCDLRRPIMHKFFGMPNIHGVTDVLAGERELQEVWHEPLTGLKVANAGHVPPNPTELLSSQSLSELLSSVREEFDYVLVDTPPIGLVSDPAVIAARGDGVLLVVDAQKTRKVVVQQAMHNLNAVGAKVLGTVMNNVMPSRGDYYYGSNAAYQ